MFVRQLLAPVTSAVLAAGLLLGPLAGRAAADGTVYSVNAHHSFFVQTTCMDASYGYNVWLWTDNSTAYGISYVYPDQWQLGHRQFGGNVELENTYPCGWWAADVRYQIFEPWGALKYDWPQSQFSQQTVFCPENMWCYLYYRDVFQEYITKGGAWGNTSTWLVSREDSIILQGPRDNPTSAMP